MSDLTGELRHLADSAASQARPLPVADVIRRGDRRRRRTIAQRSVGGLSAVGVIGTAGIMLFGNAANGSQGGTAAAAGAAPGVTTVTEQTVSAAGKMTITVSYRQEPHGKLKLLALTFAGDSKAAASHPQLIVHLASAGTPPGRSLDIVYYLRPRVVAAHEFSASLPSRSLVITNRGVGLLDNTAVTAEFIRRSAPGQAKQVSFQVRPSALQVGVILAPQSVRVVRPSTSSNNRVVRPPTSSNN